MATRSNIGILQDDGTIKAIYCHWDGYPEGVGTTLASYYTTREKVEALLNLGDFSSLGETLEKTAETADPTDEERKARVFNSVNEWRDYAREQWAEYLYLYQRQEYGLKGYEWNYLEITDYWKQIPTKLIQTV